MCGRYSFVPKPKQRKALESKAKAPAALEISFNIAPTHAAYVIANDKPDELQRMEWGLVPHWSKDGVNAGKLINARAEGIAEKPSFRDPIHARRCLVPADSFFEWRKLPGGRKAPYRITRENGELLYMAGIWDEWKQGSETKRTFAVITTVPNQEMSALHDRMPVILPDADAHRLWLSPLPLAEVLSMLHPPADGTLAMYRVSERLNNPAHNGADLHEPAPEDFTLF
jgi:putative SOS response-associated peptidase YedK